MLVQISPGHPGLVATATNKSDLDCVRYRCGTRAVPSHQLDNTNENAQCSVQSSEAHLVLGKYFMVACSFLNRSALVIKIKVKTRQ